MTVDLTPVVQNLKPTLLIEMGKVLLSKNPPGPEDPAALATLGQKLVGQGEHLLAFELLESAHRLHPANLRLQQLMALALARCGATDRKSVGYGKSVELGG